MILRTLVAMMQKAYDLRHLFLNGEQGVWYDVDDFRRYMQTGPELVANGRFDSGIEGWTERRSAVLAHSSNRLRVTNGGATVSGGADTPITCQVGKRYLVTITIAATSVGRVAFVRVADKTMNLATVDDFRVSQQANPVGTYSAVFVATQTTHYVFAQIDGGVAGDWVEFDNISVKELTALDTCTLFQDSAGTTPVTAVEQPVGLMLDKSKGLVLGAELVTNGNLSGFLSNGLALLTTTSLGGLTGTGAYANILTIGKWYKVQISATSSSGTFSVNTSSGSPPNARTEIGTGLNKTFYFFADRPGFYLRCNTEASASGVSISVRELPGNHAFQPTAIDRPILRNRYNLLTKTEQFDDAVWVKQNVTTPSASVIADNASSGFHAVYVAQAFASASYTFTIEAKKGTAQGVFIRVRDAISTGTVHIGALVDLNAGTVISTQSGTVVVTPMPDAWYRITLTGPISAGTWSVIVGTVDGDQAFYVGSGKTTLVRNASLVPADQSNLPYQRVNTATDYDSDPNKFPLYLAVNGVNTWMQTNSIDFSGTDKVTVFAGVRKLSDAATGLLAEISTDVFAVTGAFSFLVPAGGGANKVTFVSRGTSGATATTTTSAYNAPLSAVLTGAGSISGDTARLRISGVEIGTSTTDQGTGNYGNYPLYLFRRAGTSLPFNGNFYGLVIRGALCTDQQTSYVERLMARAMKITF